MNLEKKERRVKQRGLGIKQKGNLKKDCHEKAVYLIYDFLRDYVFVTKLNKN